MNNGYIQIFYVHKVTKTVINLADLRCMSDDEKVVVEKIMCDDLLNIDYNYINSYSKTDIMSCYDWDIVPIADNMSKIELDKYNLNKKYVDACKKYNYIGYDIESYNDKNIEMERRLF